MIKKLPSNDFDTFFREGDIWVEFLENCVVPPRVVPAINSRQNLHRQNEGVVLLLQHLQVVPHHNRPEKNRFKGQYTEVVPITIALKTLL